MGRAADVVILAGNNPNLSGAIRQRDGGDHTFSPLNVWDMQLNQGRDLTLRQPEGWSTALVVLSGWRSVRSRP
jgi:redox-sensitive bicupin YhaK (pirin superfamily)